LAVNPSDALVSVNGFEMGSRREFQVSTDAEYAFEVSAPGHRTVETVARCGTSVRKEVTVKLPSGGKDDESAAKVAGLSDISRTRGLPSLFVIEARGEEFKLYLYTRDLALEEIPLRAPLRVAEVLGHPTESTMPIATDAFLSLWEKQRAKTAGEIDLSPEPFAGGAAEIAAGAPTPGDSKWYNSPTFWWIAGGVAGGILVTYLLTRQGEPVRSQPSGISIKID
jgi:hypothetical protein